MEPKRPEFNLGPEQVGVSYGQNLEQTPEQQHVKQFEIGHESTERQGEMVGGVVSTTTLPAPIITSTTPAVAIDDSTTGVSSGGATPALAGDEDLIEKEWVDKAKKIILQTKDDPYRREQEVGKLQADYLQKRYGREMGAPQ